MLCFIWRAVVPSCSLLCGVVFHLACGWFRLIAVTSIDQHWLFAAGSLSKWVIAVNVWDKALRRYLPHDH